MRARPITAAALVALISAALPACGHRATDPLIGMHRTGLDISFKGEPAGPNAPQVTFQPPAGLSGALAPFTAGVNRFALPASFNFDFKLPGNLAALTSCPAAPRGATAQDVAVAITQDPPKEGIYITHNTGRVDVRVGSPSNPEVPSTVPQPAPGGIPVPPPPASPPEGSAVTASFDFPPTAAYAVKDTGKTSTPNEPPAGYLHATDLVVKYSFVFPGVNGASSTFQYESRDTTGDAGVYLVRRVDKAKDSKGDVHVVRTFTPQPAVPIMKWGGTGTTWNTTGIDPATGEILSVQGTVVGSSQVDVCGKVYNAYEVHSFERDIDPVSGTQTLSSYNDPNVYFIATQLGGLLLKQHVHTTCTCPQSASSDVNGQKVPAVLPVEVTLNYTMTLNSTAPYPLSLYPL